MATCDHLTLVMVGHVDHGKSTVVGRLLADTGSLPEGRLEQVRILCEQAGKRFEYAFLLDALSDEQHQGITIEAARISFRTARRRYLILDAPGHIEFVRNMVTGASQAEAAVLVIDAEEGIRENSRRHGYLLSLLGLRSLLVLINKMDRVAYREARFRELEEQYRDFLGTLGVTADRFLPVSGLEGENITSPSAAMPWFEGPTVLEALDALEPAPPATGMPFRMYVQDVYKFTRYGDSRRIVAGTVSAGELEPGDEVVFYPSGKRSRVRTLEGFGDPPAPRLTAGNSAGFTLEEEVYVTRGELVVRADQPPPQATSRLAASLFWTGAEPMTRDREYLLKLGTAAVPARLEAIHRVIDACTLEPLPESDVVGTNQAAEAVLRLKRTVAFDGTGAVTDTRRFVIVDGYRIAGGGIVRQALEDHRSTLRERKYHRNRKWIHSRIAPEERAERYSQKPCLIVITGPRHSDRKGLARALEARLFQAGRLVYFLAMGSLKHGLDADLEDGTDAGREHIRRMAEVANLMLDAGLLLVVSAAGLNAHDLELVRELVSPDRVKTVLLGEGEVECDLHLPEERDRDGAVERVYQLLIDGGVIFGPW